MRCRINDQRDGENLPPAPVPDLLLFHWSPIHNRDRINHSGLTPGRPSLQGDWKPPYVCFSDDPMLAWVLSGTMWPSIQNWDLWQVNMRTQTSFTHHELILDTFPGSGRHYTKEYRVYHRIFKRDVHWVGIRSQP